MLFPSAPTNRRLRWLPILLLLGLSYIPLFWLLDSLPAQQWDESRTALNALGIGIHHDWIVLRHLGQPDLWNGKPPLWPWLLSLSFRALGPTELALRLPAALAALATVLLLYRAASRWLNSPWAGLLAGLVLLTSQGYVTLHVARSGDYDALLTLWTTAGALNWLAYLRTGRNRWAWLTGVCFALAVFTKGIAGTLLGPGLILTLVLTKAWPRLRRPAPWLAAALVILTMVGWYAGREMAAPGYWEGVWAYEVGGPAGTALEGHSRPFEWYTSMLAEHKFTIWVVPALLGWLISARLPRHSRGWWLSRFTAAVIPTYLLVISVVQTKVEWYDAQVYPLLALQAAAGLTWLGRILAAHLKQAVTVGAQATFVLVLAAFPYVAQWQYIRGLDKRKLLEHQTLYGRHIEQQVRQMPEVRDYLLITDGTFNDAPEFQRTAAEQLYEHKVKRLARWELPKFRPGQVLVACGVEAYGPLMRTYHAEVLFQTDSCRTLVIPGTPAPNP